VLLPETLDEIAELFSLEEVFPFAQEELDEDVESTPGFWGRIARWFGWRPAGSGG
jgi:hypothetical protein